MAAIGDGRIGTPVSGPPLGRLGPYLLQETVATLSFGIVYRARHAVLGRSVLVKTLKPTVSLGSAFTRRLEREATILGSLQHEGIVRLYDFTRTPEAVWLVLEDAPGALLGEVLDRSRLDLATALAIALGIARALGHAHEHGVVHADLRPAHVELAPDGVVRIVDFSSAFAPGLGFEAESGEGGGGLGRPDYLAPEQIVGGTAGTRSDVFSLGAVAYELVAGVRPFAAEAGKEVVRRIRGSSPAPLDTLAPGIPRSALHLIARCLAKDPDDRFPDATAVALALEGALASLSTVDPRLLVMRALAAGRKGGAPLGQASAAREAGEHVDAAGGDGPSPARALRSLAVVLGLILAGGTFAELAREGDSGSTETGATTKDLEVPWSPGSHDRGYLRVLAKPWADVYVDGERVDTTPVGRPIAVSPGQHFVTFRHPSAPDEERQVKLAAGQTLLLDVTMRVERARPDAGASPIDAGQAEESP